MPSIEYVHWNPPKSKVGKILSFLPFARINNFGDLLGPMIVSRMVGERQPLKNRRLLTVGSILHLARENDVIWGSGRNGKIPSEQHTATKLDVRAVRGPLTRDFLLERGHKVPEIYGDPGLLFGKLFPELFQTNKEPIDVVYIPNFNDQWNLSVGSHVLNPMSPVAEVMETIARAGLVIASSLHAIIIAESLGIPAVPVKSKEEPAFKYLDYYLGTDRSDINFAESPAHALDISAPRRLNFQEDQLLGAFPHDLWRI